MKKILGSLFMLIFCTAAMLAQNSEKKPESTKEQQQAMEEAMKKMEIGLDSLDLKSLMSEMGNLEMLLDSSGMINLSGEDLNKLFEGMSTEELNSMMAQGMKLFESLDMNGIEQLLEGIDMNQINKMLEGMDMDEMSKMFEGFDMKAFEDLLAPQVPAEKEDPKKKTQKRI